MALVRSQDLRSSPVQSWDLANFGTFGGLFGDFDRLFNEVSGRLNPVTPGAAQSYPVDLYETGEALVLQMAVPGIRSEELDISIEGRQLTIQGSYPQPEEREGRRYWLQTIPHGQFRRTVTLPTGVEADGIEARVTDGLLTLTMPKVAEAKARRITVNAG